MLPDGVVLVPYRSGRRTVRVVRRIVVHGRAGADTGGPGARAGTPPRPRGSLWRPQPGTGRLRPAASCAGLDPVTQGCRRSDRTGRGRLAMAAAGRQHLP